MSYPKLSKNHFTVTRVAAAVWLALCAAQAGAEQLVFSNAPAVNSHKPPAPNVIVSVDDSGSMSGTKMTTLKAALRDTFKEENIPDGVIRLAWQSMNRCYEIPSSQISNKKEVGCSNLNSMKVLDSTHRKNFLDWVDKNLTASGNTPSHRMLDEAGKYLMKTNLGVNSPWARIPGETVNPILSCRRSYSIFLTDGDWNQTDTRPTNFNNEDNLSQKFPDGTEYKPSANQSRIYKDSTARQFADLAFKYWYTDLQPDIADGITPSINQPGTISISSGSKTLALEEYWNPRNNPATWQHLTLYTIGFGTGAAGWSNFPTWGTDTWTGTDYDSIMVGDKNWSSAKGPDMWHAAINSRGKFVPVIQNDDLAPAFREILEDIMVEASKPLTSVKLSASTTRVDSYIYAAGYDPANWSGQVSAFKLKAATGAYDTVHVWGSNGKDPHTTQSLLDEKAKTSNFHTNRVVWSSRPGSTSGSHVGIHFKWNDLNSAQQNTFNAGDSRGQNRVNFIRGDRSQEKSTLRERTSLHGDIVGSNVWLTPGYVYGTKTGSSTRPSMLYVGANDGMLHAFDASTGQEKMAYIPRGLFSSLVDFTNRGYTHKYYVDGSPFTGEVNVGGGDKDYLVGFLGAGGRGYFILDVTEPQNFATTDPAGKVIMDNTDNPDNDIGYIFATPSANLLNVRVQTQITKLNDNRPALVIGNGYNSVNERPVLIIQYLDGNKEVKKLVANNATGKTNGLSAPRLVDLSGDGIPDVAYAGDLLGNMWKFDISSEVNSNWKVSFDGKPIVNVGQPILNAPAYSAHSSAEAGGLMLMFGTGRNLTQIDWTSTSTQRIYGIHDPTSWKIGKNSVTGSNKVVIDQEASALDDLKKLVEQEFKLSNEKINENPTWIVTSNNVDYTNSDKNLRNRGWYVDLNTRIGARVLRNVEFYSGKTYIVNFTVPAQNTDGDNEEETCIAKFSSGVDYTAYLDIENGSFPKDGVFEGMPKSLVVMETVDGLASMLTDAEGNPIPVNSPGRPTPPKLKKFTHTTLQPSWRQVE